MLGPASNTQQLYAAIQLAKSTEVLLLLLVVHWVGAVITSPSLGPGLNAGLCLQLALGSHAWGG
jgi:hypothetical protein